MQQQYPSTRAGALGAGATPTISMTNVYVAGVGPDFNDEKFRAMFGHFGEVESMKCVLDHATQKCRGIAFIRYKSHESAAKAIEEMNGH